MNDDLMLSDGVSSSDEEIPYQEPKQEVVIRKCLDEIVSDAMSKHLKNEFEIFSMASK
jgi:hypothetical protein